MVCKGENFTTTKPCCLHCQTKNGYELNITKLMFKNVNMKNAFEKWCKPFLTKVLINILNELKERMVHFNILQT
jgi:hypothetical protein